MVKRLDGLPHKYDKKKCFCCEKYFTPTGSCSKRCPTCRILSKRIVKEGTCVKCGGPLDSLGTKRCLFCRTRYSIAKQPGVGTGNGQGKGEDNHNYKSGIGLFKKYRKKNCERCGSTKFLCVHHKDQNRYNNELSNLETLCKRCHQLEHNCAKVLIDYVKRDDVKKKLSEFAKSRKDLVRDSLGRYRRHANE